ncbi:MAG: hypothetical protein RIR89_1222 [Actinomycetota bacterium]
MRKNQGFMALSTLLVLTSCTGSIEEDPAPPADPAEAFIEVAMASCDKALAEGVVEDTPGLELMAVMVPKEMGIDGYSAAYFQAPDTYELIWETDFFFACSIANQATLSEEAGVQLDLDVEVDGDRYLVTQLDFDQNPYTTEYFVDSGLIQKASSDSGGETIETLISYGGEMEASLEIISEALLRFE